MKQSLRTRNRLREHKDHGWTAIGEIDRNIPGLPEGKKILLECPCGWLGWILEKELNEPST